MHLLTPHTQSVDPFVYWENEFSNQELNWLQNEARHATDSGFVGSHRGGVVNTETRRSQVKWLYESAVNNWVFERLAHVVSSINSSSYRFDLLGFGEPLQLTNYNSTETGMYGWHQDYGGTVSRKLSLVIQLSDPSEYEGGNLQIQTGLHPETVRKQRGLITLFPSYTLHQVTPVTQGSRQSLVAWITGPAFR
jgi:PKHD-type hydroxylase